ncbi:MAG TPA: hypothetical protein VK348_13475 [Planctomycetota bacterium]|nr:hypothetical protein [Planctomycetota bacterium]
MAVPEGLIAQAWTVLCAVLAPAVFGAGIVRWLGLGPAHGWRVFAAWSYLVGQYTLAHATSLWLLARQPLPGWCLPLFALLGGSALLLAHRRRGIDRSDTPPAHDRWLGLLCIVLAIVCIDQFLRVNVQPILASDEGDIWSAKAKVLYCADSMPVPFGLALYARHTDYPLFDPLVQVLAFASHGRVLQWENRLPIQCFGISLLLLLSAALGHYTSRWLAAAAMVAFTSSLFFQCTTTAYADVMVAFALLAAVDGWLRWQQTGERVWWRLCCFGLAALLASKNEGSMLAVAAVVAVVIVRLLQGRRENGARLRWQWLWLLLPLGAVACNRGFNAWFGCSNDLLDPVNTGGHGLFGQIVALLGDRALPVVGFYGGMLVDRAQQRLLVLLLLVAALLRGRRVLAGPQLLPLLTVVGALVGYMLVFVGTHFEVQWHLATAADRTVLQVLPTAVLALGMHLGGGAAAARGAAA